VGGLEALEKRPVAEHGAEIGREFRHLRLPWLTSGPFYTTRAHAPSPCTRRAPHGRAVSLTSL
jgi:hypothetical protein